jgi:hypothetical protein
VGGSGVGVAAACSGTDVAAGASATGVGAVLPHPTRNNKTNPTANRDNICGRIFAPFVAAALPPNVPLQPRCGA